ncbi:hypothetical protein HRbin36_01290 [bacterium HR36]|nr:hypothetical protein HRbin36_01290 [bacterium HR36]
MRLVRGVVLVTALLVCGCGQRDPQVVGTAPTLPVLKPGGVPGVGGSPTGPVAKPQVE